MRLSFALPVRHLAGTMLSLLMAGTAFALTADQVMLKNGDRITGHVLETGTATLSLQTEAAGMITIQRRLIEKVIPGEVAPDVLVQSAVGVSPKVPAPSDCMQGAKPVSDTWSFSLQGAPNTVVLGTQSQEQFGAGLNLSLCEGTRLNATNLTAKGNHLRSYEMRSASIKTDVAAAELEQQRFFRNPQGAGIYGTFEVFTNNSLGMALEKSAALGLLSPQYRYKALFYDFAADVRYVNQHFDHTSAAQNLAAVRIREQMHLQGRLFAWDEQAWIMPALNDGHALQVYASAGPSVTLKPWLHLGLNEEESYLGNAPSPNRKNYFSSTLSLTLQRGSGSRAK